MATAPAFAATPRIGCGHITAASPDLGTVTASTPATVGVPRSTVQGRLQHAMKRLRRERTPA